MDSSHRHRPALHLPRRARALAATERPAYAPADEGWTFIETLAVVAIILILTAAVGFVAVRWIASANRAAGRTQVETLSVALAAYFVDAGTHPTAEQGLAALWEKPVLEPVPKNWNGPYLAKPVPRDPWGFDYEYRVPGPHGLPYGIRSLGADGKEGGDGQDADIESWSN